MKLALQYPPQTNRIGWQYIRQRSGDGSRQSTELEAKKKKEMHNEDRENYNAMVKQTGITKRTESKKDGEARQLKRGGAEVRSAKSSRSEEGFGRGNH